MLRDSQITTDISCRTCAPVYNRHKSCHDIQNALRLSLTTFNTNYHLY